MIKNEEQTDQEKREKAERIEERKQKNRFSAIDNEEKQTHNVFL